MKRIITSASLVLALMFAGTAVPATAAPSDSASAPSVSLLTPPAMPKISGDQPKGVFAPKGRPGVSTSSNVSTLSTTYYRYAGARQSLATGETANSFAANLHVTSNVYLDTARGDFHTLGEIAVQSSDQKQTVEVGITKDAAVCGAGVNKVCLFVYWWKNGVGQGYNGSGFVDYASEPLNAGADVSADTGTQKRVQIANTGTAWWIGYNLKWVGYYPNTLWSASTPSGPGVTFTTATKFNAFYEAATSVDKTCTDIGNGYLASDVNSARLGSMSLGGVVPSTVTANFTPFVQLKEGGSWPTTVLDALSINGSPTDVRAGSPGWNSTGTAAGTRLIC